jgi:hypothetical protein
MNHTRRISAAATLLALLLPVLGHAQAQDQALDSLLRRTGVKVTQFLDRLADVKCREDILQEKLDPKGKAEEKVQSQFEYLVVTENQGNEPMLYESREVLREGHEKKNVPLLVTNGFATQLLVFHPYYQPSFSFDRLPDAHLNGKTYVQVHFQHIKGRLTPAVLLLRGREYPLSLSGTARIDPATGDIDQITTELAESMQDLGLKSYSSQVIYSPVAFQDQGGSYVLPAQATVEVSTPRQRWKNVHHFTNYQHFSVTVTEKVHVEKLKEQESQKDQEGQKEQKKE